MELELKGTPKIRATYEGKEYFLQKPKLGQALKLESILKEAEAAGAQNAAIVDFIAECGLPKEVLLGMEVDLLDQIVQALLPIKKKN